MLMFNLAHDVLVKFRSDGSCSLEKFSDEGEPAIVLDQKAQLLLLDALCHAYSFASPISKVVKTHEIGHQGDPPTDELPEGTLDLSMPDPDNVLPKDPHDGSNY